MIIWRLKLLSGLRIISYRYGRLQSATQDSGGYSRSNDHDNYNDNYHDGTNSHNHNHYHNQIRYENVIIMLRAGVVLEEMHLNDRLWEIKFGHSLPAKGDTLVPQGVNTLPSSCITQY